MAVDAAIVQMLLSRANTPNGEISMLYEAVVLHEELGLRPLGWNFCRRLLDLVASTEEGNAQPECLVGVVVAMIPQGWAWSITQVGEMAGAMVCRPGQMADTVELVESASAHAALLRALLSSILAGETRHG